jgi:hypothetical protein
MPQRFKRVQDKTILEWVSNIFSQFEAKYNEFAAIMRAEIEEREKNLTPEQKDEEEVAQFIGCNWYQLAGTDEQIIQNFVFEASVEYIREIVGLLKRFLASSKSDREKAGIIVNAADRFFEIAPGEEDNYSTALQWLKEVVSELEKAI